MFVYFGNESQMQRVTFALKFNLEILMFKLTRKHFSYKAYKENSFKLYRFLVRTAKVTLYAKKPF